MIGLLLAATLFVAFVNGANDNFKGVATLHGSGVLSYRSALAIATLSTAAGSLMSVALASGLAKAFSAKGLVPDAMLTPEYLAAVALAAALTVLAATLLGMPVSTTHALVGGLVGAGLVTAGRELNVLVLGVAFMGPLVVSPLLAVPLAALAYGAGRRGRRRLGIEAESCVCVGEEWVPLSLAGSPAAARTFAVSVGTAEQCQKRYVGRIAGVSAQAVATTAHAASASLVGFARGVNDTPKILGLVVGAAALSPWAGTVAITIVMALGGLLAASRVARTLSTRVTTMNPGQGLAGNLCTSLLVVAASRFGLPVSTTHVSTGSIFGIGAAGSTLRWRMVGAILLAWVTTLPMATALGAAAMWALPLVVAPARAASPAEMEIVDGVDGEGRLSDLWHSMIRRLHPETADAAAAVRKPLTGPERRWADRIRARSGEWASRRAEHDLLFAPVLPPARVRIVLGNRGGEDAFTHDAATIGFDLSALQSAYGDAAVPENQARIDRFFDHEYTHLLQKAWLADRPWEAGTPLREALLAIWLEGLGNHRSLSERWRSSGGAPSRTARETLAGLEPRFAARLAALACATPAAAAPLTRDLSMGRFDAKWGALPAALWLEAEAAGDPGALRRFVLAGPEGVWDLAARNLPEPLRAVVAEARQAASLCGGPAPALAGRLTARFIGNASFEIADGSATVLTDFPYESGAFGYMEYRSEEVRPEGKVLSLITHPHRDHWDPALFTPTGWFLAAPVELTRGVDPSRVVPEGDSMAFEGVRMTPVRTPHRDVPHVSWMIEWHGLRLYITGDTEEVDAIRSAGRLDVLFVTPWLLHDLLRSGQPLPAPQVILHHHTPADRIPSCAGCIVPEQGERILLGPG